MIKSVEFTDEGQADLRVKIFGEPDACCHAVAQLAAQLVAAIVEELARLGREPVLGVVSRVVLLLPWLGGGQNTALGSTGSRLGREQVGDSAAIVVHV
jgi:hypothetical protein